MDVEQLEAMLARGTDNALLRYSLGAAYLKDGRPAQAIEHLHAALEHDPGYSAAWKSYAKALSEAGRTDEAIEAYREGIGAAEAKGDVQAGKEMRVFLRRLEKASSPP